MDQLIGRAFRRPDRWRRFDLDLRPALGIAVMLGCWSSPAGSGETAPPSIKDVNEPPRVATAARDSTAAKVVDVARAPLIAEAPTPVEVEADPIARAKRAIADCQARYDQVKDYSCKFYKHERIDGRLVKPHIMVMKARKAPTSFYFKFEQPNAGREAIYVAGKNKGRVYAHDVGLGRVLAGTMNLDPRGSMAMEENRHPITEAGIGSMIETIRQRWDIELHPGEAKIIFHPTASVDQRPCTLIETIHPSKQDDFLYHKVKLYIDHELGLPIRFEAYDWPKKPGMDPELVEEYTYAKLRVNVDLHDRDFDPTNSLYSFGRF